MTRRATTSQLRLEIYINKPDQTDPTYSTRCFTNVSSESVVDQTLLKAFSCLETGARCSSVVRALSHGAILHGGPIELFLVQVSAPRLSVG